MAETTEPVVAVEEPERTDFGRGQLSAFRIAQRHLERLVAIYAGKPEEPGLLMAAEEVAKVCEMVEGQRP